MAAVRWIVWHHTHAGPGYPSVWSTADYHAGPSPMGAPGICYHVYIEEDGTAYLCHSMEAVTWHAGSGSPTSKKGIGSNNWESVGVCLAGEHPTPAQLESARRVADAIDAAFERRLQRVGHRDLSRGLTECPGSRFDVWRREVGA
jgi:N-acetyl-anhydromuramyl-L-alanine amidase AmpD